MSEGKLSVSGPNSNNNIQDRSNISLNTIAGLAIEYGFEVIPDTTEVTAAGYTGGNRLLSQVWYGPVMDEEVFTI